MNDLNISWKNIWGLRLKFILVVKALFIIVLLDFVISILLSLFLSDSFYFEKYVSDDYEEIVSDFYENKYYIELNKEVGWTNRPNLRNSNDMWATNSFGSRISPQQVETNTQEKVLTESKNLTFILGSSVLNGFILPYEEIPGSYLNSHGYDTFTFASVLHTVGQSYALYESALAKYRPKVLVVGIHNDADSMTNMFAAFRDKASPFLKPRYQLSGNELIKITPPYEDQASKNFPLMLSILKKNDAHYYRFEYFKRLGLLPFSDLLRKVILKGVTKFYSVDEYIKDVELQISVMDKITQRAKENGTEVIFIKLEGLFDQKKPLHNRLFDQYLHKDKNVIHNQLLGGTSFNIIYLSEVLKATGEPVSTFYFDDQVHLTKKGSALLAKRIDQEISRVTTKN